MLILWALSTFLNSRSQRFVAELHKVLFVYADESLQVRIHT